MQTKYRQPQAGTKDNAASTLHTVTNGLADFHGHGEIGLVSRVRSSLDFTARSGANFGFDKDTSKPMIPVSFMVQKFARRTRGNDGANF